MIGADGVTYGYDDPVISDVDLAVVPGEVLALVGPSGTGKTTLLRLLALFDPPEAGVVRVEGRDAWTLDVDERFAARRRIGMVFQHRSLFTGSVAHNTAYGLTVRRSWIERVRRWIDRLGGGGTLPDPARRALETVGMAEAADRDASALSAGEAQRIAFARALAVDPDVLLLDEPTSNLDPRNTAVIEDAVADARDRGIGVIVATHDMAQARRVADRAAVLLNGECIERGPIDRVFDRPRDDRARAFVDGELVY